MKIKNQMLAAAVAVALCGCAEQKPANPLFSDFTAPFGIAPFEEITVDHFREGMLKGLEEQKAEIEALINSTENLLLKTLSRCSTKVVYCCAR